MLTLKKLEQSGFFFIAVVPYKSFQKKLQNIARSAIIMVVSWLSFWHMETIAIFGNG